MFCFFSGDLCNTCLVNRAGSGGSLLRSSARICACWRAARRLGGAARGAEADVAAQEEAAQEEKAESDRPPGLYGEGGEKGNMWPATCYHDGGIPNTYCAGRLLSGP